MMEHPWFKAKLGNKKLAIDKDALVAFMTVRKNSKKNINDADDD
jgi:hypothetical protein